MAIASSNARVLGFHVEAGVIVPCTRFMDACWEGGLPFLEDVGNYVQWSPSGGICSNGLTRESTPPSERNMNNPCRGCWECLERCD